MQEYVECNECGFVLLSASTTSPEPEAWEACPDCGSREFNFTGRRDSGTGGQEVS